jgi:hypothetical protein
MPRQNRVTPFGEVASAPERGTMMGNWGVLHDAEGHIHRSWQVRRWLICVLEFHGRHREVMSPGRYTELFFLDEATALAAGHRPCQAVRFLLGFFRFDLGPDVRSPSGLVHHAHPALILPRSDRVGHRRRLIPGHPARGSWAPRRRGSGRPTGAG